VTISGAQVRSVYPTRAAAKEAAIVINRAYPVLQLTVFDAEEEQSEVIVLPPE